MPSWTLRVANLEQNGPTLEVVVDRARPLGSGRQPRRPRVARSVRVTALVDTGASRTAIAPAVVRALGLQPVGLVLVSTPSTTEPVVMRRFDVSLELPNGLRVIAPAVVEAPVGGQEIQCLIGRDVLAAAVLVYDGRAGEFSLTF